MRRVTTRWGEGGSVRRVGLNGILCGLLLLPTGCSTEPWELVDVRISVIDPVFTPQTPVEFEITAVNRGRSEVSLDSAPCPPPFDVLDASGSVVGPGMTLCTLELREPTRLAPGQAVSYTFSWSGDLYTVGGGTNMLPFGDYALRGWALVLPDHRVLSETVAVRFRDGDG